MKLHGNWDYDITKSLNVPRSTEYEPLKEENPFAYASLNDEPRRSVFIRASLTYENNRKNNMAS
jgi:hypothetical protein